MSVGHGTDTVNAAAASWSCRRKLNT